jgi:hypothetical protein
MIRTMDAIGGQRAAAASRSAGSIAGAIVAPADDVRRWNIRG